MIEESFFETDIAASQMAVHLITEWNKKNLIDRMVRINLPEVWTFASGSSNAGKKVLRKNPRFPTIKSLTPTMDGPTIPFLGHG